jgi:hypothetical protein
MASDRPNQHTLEILSDPTIRDRAEDAARALQDAARERQRTTRHPEDPAPEQER